MIWSTYRQGVRENLRFVKIFPWILLAICGIGVAILWRSNSNNQPLDVDFDQVSAFMVFRVLALASAILSSWIVSSEVEQKTIVYLLTRPIPRWMLLLGRYLASVTLVTVVGLMCLLGVTIGVYGMNLYHGTLTFASIEAIVLGAFSYGALFLFLSLILNRSMLVSLLFAFGWEASIPNLPGTAYWFSIFTHLITIAHRGLPPPTDAKLSLLTVSLNAGKLTIAESLSVLVGSTTFFLVLGVLIFTQFEFVPREDAG